MGARGGRKSRRWQRRNGEKPAITLAQQPASTRRQQEVKPADVVPDATTDSVSGRSALLILAIILLVAAAVRLVGIDAKSLWGDELWTISSAVGRSIHGNLPADTIIDPPIERITRLEGAGPWWQVWTRFDNNLTQPPLYWVVLRLWREALGESDVAARLLSVAFSLAAIVLTYDVGRLLSGRATGLWAAGLMALATPQVLYALEVRNYTIQLVLALGAGAVLLRIERRGASWGRLAGLCALTLGLLLSHYFAVGAEIGLGLYAMIRLRGSARWKTLLALSTSAALFALLWGRNMLAQGPKFRVAIDENTWLFQSEPGRAAQALLDAVLIPGRQITRLDGPSIVGGALVAALLLAALLTWRKRPDLHLPLCWLAGTIGLITALDMSRSSLHLLYIRYTVLAGPGVFLLVAGLIAPYGHWRHILPAGACLWCLPALPRVHGEAYEPFWRGGIEDWRAPAAFLSQNAQPSDLIIFSPEGANEFAARMSLLAVSHYMGRINTPILLSLAPPNEQLLGEIARRRPPRIWVVTYESPLVQSERFLPGIEVRNTHVVPWTAIIWETRWPPADAPAP